MEDQTIIRIAVWNIDGPTHGKKYPQTIRKINAFQKAISPDIAFYLEAPNLPGNVSNENWAESFYAQAEPDNPRGILTVKYKSCEDKNIIVEKNHVPAEGKTALGLEVKISDKEKFRIIGVWTTPKSSKSPHCELREQDRNTAQGKFFDALADILQYYRDKDFLKSDVPCIVIGDTNVNLSARAKAQADIRENACHANIDGLKNLTENYGLSFPLPLSKPGMPEGKTLNTLHSTNHLWYRCDLMMISAPSILNSACLGEPEYEDEDGKISSDHAPIIFEISL